MARLAGVGPPPRKSGWRFALTLQSTASARTRSKQLIAAAEASTADTPRQKTLSDDDLAKLRVYIEENFKVEGDLRREGERRHPSEDRDRVLRGPSVASRTSRPPVSAPRPTPRTRKGSEERRFAGKKKAGKK